MHCKSLKQTQELPFCSYCLTEFSQEIHLKNSHLQFNQLVIISFSKYFGPFSKLLREIKSQELAEINPRSLKIINQLVDYRLNELKSLKLSVISYIPNSPQNKWFKLHLSQYFAQIVANKLDIPLIPLLDYNFRLTRSLKKQNNFLERYYACRKKIKIKNGVYLQNNQNILLIDDICTSGATLSYSNELLRKYYPSIKIINLVLADCLRNTVELTDYRPNV